jgi:hypothetical protein
LNSIGAITPRGLNRATLARQMLLAREALPAVQAVERLVGMQSQLARPPFLGLWSRLAGFTRDDLLQPLHARTIVRVTAMRATLHLLSSADYIQFRGTLQPMLTRALRSIFKSQVDGLDLERIAATAHRYLANTPATFAVLRDHLASHYPDLNPRLLGYAIRMLVPLVQVPGPDPFGFPAASCFAPADAWLDTVIDVETGTSNEALVRRYLAAFGPATPADAQTWSGLQGLRPVFEALRPSLVTLRTEDGRELFDLPDAPRPPEDITAPVRYLPEFDNLVMAYADRRRLVADEHRPRLITKNLQVPATFLVDGRIAGTWKIERKGRAATLAMVPFVELKKPALAALIKEGTALLRFAESEATDLKVIQA